MTMTVKQKKGAVYAGLGAAGVAVVGLLTYTTEPQENLRPPITSSLTGGVNTRELSIEALAVRLGDLEKDRTLDQDTVTTQIGDMRNHLNRIVAQMEQGREMDQSAQQSHELRESQARIATLEAMLKDMQRHLVARDTYHPPEVMIEEGTNDEFMAAIVEQKGPPPDTVVAKPVMLDRQPAPAPEPAVAEAPEPEPAREPEVEVQFTPRIAPAQLYEPAPTMPMVQQQQRGPAIAASAIREIEPEVPEVPEALAEAIPPLIIPTGSIITTRLITGLDAPTGTKAQEQPMPVLLRISDEAIMPNNWFADVVECHMLGGAYGELASERVHIRGEVASCVLRDGSVVEAKAKFFAAGEDGKVGVRGRHVSRAGEALARTAAAGFGSGLSGALSDGATAQVDVTAGGLLSAGASGASSDAFEKLADYYIDLAEQAHPIIEVVNNRTVDVVLTERLEIRFDGT